MAESLPFDPSRVLAESAWLRRFARRLAWDAAAADDLVQDTLLAAIDRRPRADSDLRPWLARVARRLALRGRRSERRRMLREQSVAEHAPTSTPGVDTMLDQIEAHRAVSRALGELAEPYRNAVFLRYWRELAPREIASELGVPVETVRTRIKRGLALLRERLDRDHEGSRQAWALPLLAVATWPRHELQIALGASMMKSKLIGLSVAAALLLTTLTVLSLPEAPHAVAAADPSETAVAAALSSDTEPESAVRRAREEASGPGPSSDPESPPSPVAVALHGQVVDLSGGGVPGVIPDFLGEGTAESGGDPIAETDGEGRFVLFAPIGNGEVGVETGGFTTVFSAWIGSRTAKPEDPAVVVVAPALRAGGTVEDERGQPIPGAVVRCSLPPSVRADLPQVLDRSEQVPWLCTSDADGRFVLPAVGRIEGATISATRTGVLVGSIAQPETDTENLRIVLRAPRPRPGDLQGQVVDPARVPVAGAQVSFGRGATQTDDQGRFVISRESAGSSEAVLALKRGFRPARHPLRVDPGSTEEIPFLILELGPPPLSLRGRFVDPLGKGIAGLRVWAADPLVFGAMDDSIVAVEAYLGGGKSRSERAGLGGLARAFFGGGGSEPTAKWGFVRTDREGRFVLPGLLDRDYRIGVLHMESLSRTELGPFAAGSELGDLVFDTDRGRQRIAGRVRSPHGQPLAGIHVTLLTDVLRLQHRSWNAQGEERIWGSGSSESGQEAVTDAEGFFEFSDACVVGTYLQVSGGGVLQRSYGREAERGLAALGMPLQDLRLTVSRRASLRVHLQDPGPADRIQILDEAGEPLRIWVFAGEGVDRYSHFNLVEGRTGVLSVDERASTLLLLQGDREVRRQPILLDPAKVTVLR